jgi:enoyl-CoA hydratase/carnithine racemase
MSELIDIGNEGHLRIVRLNRPEKKNARNAALARGSTSASRLGGRRSASA